MTENKKHMLDIVGIIEKSMEIQKVIDKQMERIIEAESVGCDMSQPKLLLLTLTASVANQLPSKELILAATAAKDYVNSDVVLPEHYEVLALSELLELFSSNWLLEETERAVKAVSVVGLLNATH